MSEMNHQVLEKKKIIKAITISLVIGTIILVGAVLPAEYGIDPTGAGKQNNSESKNCMMLPDGDLRKKQRNNNKYSPSLLHYREGRWILTQVQPTT